MKTQTTRRQTRNSMLRTRCSDELKRRVQRLADVRECDEADIVREAASIGVTSEEARLGLPPIAEDAAA